MANFFSIKYLTGKEGWYNYSEGCAPGGSRILMRTSPPINNSNKSKKRENENYISSSNKKHILLVDLIRKLTSDTNFLCT